MKERSRSVYDLSLLLVIISAVAFAAITVHSQNQTATQTPAPGPTAAQSPRATPSPSPTPTPINWSTDPMLKRFVFRSIGPASMGGRIDDITAVEQNPYIIYVAFATNGVWKSTNNGTTFQPIFDTYGTLSVGDIAIAPAVARRNARALGRTFESELRILALHGLLHLMGYDHETDNGAMDRLESRLRRQLRLA